MEQGRNYNYKLELENKIYTFPDNLNCKDMARYLKALSDNKFTDVTKNEAKYTLINRKKYIYTMIHPEHTETNRVNGAISFDILSDEIDPISKQKKVITKQVQIDNGIAIANNQAICDCLVKAGFREVSKKEKE